MTFLLSIFSCFFPSHWFLNTRELVSVYCWLESVCMLTCETDMVNMIKITPAKHQHIHTVTVTTLAWWCPCLVQHLQYCAQVKPHRAAGMALDSQYLVSAISPTPALSVTKAIKSMTGCFFFAFVMRFGETDAPQNRINVQSLMWMSFLFVFRRW